MTRYDREGRSAAYPDRSYYDEVAWGINRRGLRGVEPFADRSILLLVGSSVTFGWGVKPEDAFAGILGRRLRERDAGEWDAINAGVPGYTSHQSLVTLDQSQRRYPIGAAVFEAGINDGTWAPVRSDRELAMLSRPPGFGSALQRSNSR